MLVEQAVQLLRTMQKYFNNTKYQIFDNENAFNLTIEFGYGESIVIHHDSLINKSFKIAVKNPQLFMTEYYLPLQNIDKAYPMNFLLTTMLMMSDVIDLIVIRLNNRF